MAASDFKPLRGKYCALDFAKTGGTTPGVMAGINWTLAGDGKLDDVSNFLTGRLKTDTLHDATVTFTAVESDPPTTIGVVKMGDTGILKLYVAEDLSRWISLPVIIGSVGPKVEDQEKAVRVDITAAFSALFVGSAWVNTINWNGVTTP